MVFKDAIKKNIFIAFIFLYKFLQKNIVEKGEGRDKASDNSIPIH